MEFLFILFCSLSVEFVSDRSFEAYNFEVDPRFLRSLLDFCNFVHPYCRGPWFKSLSRDQLPLRFIAVSPESLEANF
jgi:hypothetical protein